MTSTRKLKILCIHGYRQNAQAFKEKTGALRKLLKNHADLVYITAPHRVPPGNLGSAAWADQEDGNLQENIPKETEERGWWFSREDDYFKSTDRSSISKGFDSSLELVTKTLEDDGQFDGILGFSQGACLVSMLCMMQQQEGKNWFKFAVLVAGFKSRSSNHDVYYSTRSHIPSLHVYGETDKIISTEMSEELLQFFEEPVTLKHPGGHFVAATGNTKKSYTDFFTKMKEFCDSSAPCDTTDSKKLVDIS
ncbi:esterase OVCA2-like [Physella acuta]|uniref:esterase OVCA2-like n=1 Tax=Physella acuta TaxID=109671 RepID=UPI0027DE8803|nr:esterase OVCA2-like [Physella acuta]XP_059168562.1 esterase OVCA2-like [Physella acuta]XP_059168563.1 esterase OVCA2-like [Physella acuta]